MIIMVRMITNLQGKRGVQRANGVRLSSRERERKKMKVGPIRRQNNGETVLINIEHPLMKEDQKGVSSPRQARQTHHRYQ